MNINIIRFQIDRQRDVSLLARRARLLGALADLTPSQRKNLGQAVSEICQRTLDGAGRGFVQFAIGNADGLQLVEAIVGEDPQTGSSASETVASERRLLATTSLQKLSALVDRFRLEGHPNQPNVVRLAQTIPAHLGPVDEQDVGQWAEIIAADDAEQALAIAQRRHRHAAKHISEVAVQERLQQHLVTATTSDESAALLSLVASKTDNTVIIMDAKGMIEWVNDAFTRLTGYRSEEAVGQHFAELLIGDLTNPDSVDNLRRALRHGHGINEEFLIYRPDGQTQWALFSLTPVRDDRGNISRWIVIGVDVTLRHQAQSAMQAAKEAAEASNQAKSQFLANMSHEIRTPMNTIIGMTDLTLESQLTLEQQEFLQIVKDSSQSLLALLNDMLDLSKIEAGKIQLEPVPFDLAELVQDSIAALTIKAREKGLYVDSQLSPDVPTHLRGDATRLRQVLLNLIGNAIKFTREGGVNVSVQCQWRTEAEANLLFSVRDSGIGIAPDEVDSIFDAFKQSGRSPAKDFGGSGLGLTITAELLHLMHGRIWVESEVGQGSNFQFAVRFELAESAEVDRARQLSWERRSERAGDGAVSPLRIVIADDNAANRRLATQILQRRGHQCLQATNGHEVLAAMEREPVDLIVMDVQMPELDGIQTTAAIRDRDLQTASHTPIIALTAHAMIGDREKCLEAGMDAYISKPLVARDLYTTAESLCQSADATRQEIETPDQPDDRQFATALARLEGDRELLKEQMGYFLDDGPALLNSILESLEAGEASSVHLAAHRLKGLIASFDAQPASELALRLEVLAKEQQLDGARQVLQELQPAIGQLLDQIQRFVRAG